MIDIWDSLPVRFFKIYKIIPKYPYNHAQKRIYILERVTDKLSKITIK